MLVVGIPAYNHSDLLAEALDSLVDQTYKKFITIIVDDCSTEDLKPTIKKYENKLHIKYIKLMKNSGPGMARQKALDWAKEHMSEAIMFLDSDDKLFPNAIQFLLNELRLQNVDFISSQIFVEYNNGKSALINENNLTWLHGKIFRVSFLKEYNINFLPDIKANEDVYFLSIMQFFAQNSTIKVPTYFWRNNPSSLTRTSGSFKKIVSLDIIKVSLELLSYAKEHKKLDCVCYEDFLVRLYYGYQSLLCFYDDNKIIYETKNNIIKILNDVEILQNLINKKSLKNIKEIKVFVKCQKQIYWYKQSFYNWLSEILGDNFNEDLYN